MKCRRCNGDLTRDEKRNCLRCLVCYPVQEVQPAAPKDMSKYVDQGTKWTEERIREIVRDELADWQVPKPSVTAKEVVELTSPDTTESSIVAEVPQKTWRDKAKEMGVSLYDHEKKCPRKKTDVLEDMKKAG